MTGELIDMGLDAGLIRKSGSWYSYGDERMGQGREQARAFLEENPAVIAAIQAHILDSNGIDREPTVKVPESGTKSSPPPVAEA